MDIKKQIRRWQWRSYSRQNSFWYNILSWKIRKWWHVIRLQTHLQHLHNSGLLFWWATLYNTQADVVCVGTKSSKAFSHCEVTFSTSLHKITISPKSNGNLLLPPPGGYGFTGIYPYVCPLTRLHRNRWTDLLEILWDLPVHQGPEDQSLRSKVKVGARDNCSLLVEFCTFWVPF